MEKVITFGPDKAMLGILTEPDNSSPGELPTVVFLDAGLLHRVGSCRMSTDLARLLATRGYTSFRFDFRSRGDSLSGGPDLDFETSAIEDISTALSHLEQLGKGKTFVLMGLCTGADHSHRGAMADERVLGTVMLDGYGYPTPKFYLKRYLPVFLSPVRLVKAMTKKLAGVFSKSDTDSKQEDAGVDMYLWKLPEKARFRDDLNTLIKRGANMLYIYTGGVTHAYYNYKEQLFDAFSDVDFQNRLRIEYLLHADHNYTLIEDRYEMFDIVIDWLENSFSKKPAGGTS